MTYLKKIFAISLATIIAVTTIPGAAMAQPKTLYQTSSKQTITAGATLEHLSRFTADGWLNIKVLRIDTTHPNIKIDTLANEQTTDPLSTVLTLAEKNKAVAAVNASFFNSLGGGTGYPDGPILRSGELLATSGWYNQNKDEMASFSIDHAGQVLFHYWRNSLTLTGPDNVPLVVSQYNQPSRQQYQDITVLDKKWGYTTLGASEKYPDLVEILVSQGQVAEIRQAQLATTMPGEGYVVITRGEQGAKLLETLRIGDPIQFAITSNPDWSGLEMSATGSSLLIKDGRIPETFSYNLGSFSNKNPRTMVGSSQNGKELILVTVDGRQDNSVGLTQIEAAHLMLELGAYNALIFDGGGSTTMVARQGGTNSLKVVNIPSEGSLRAVANGIGVFSTASPGQLTELILETEDPNVFVDTSRKFTLKGVDKSFNPVEIDPNQIEWSVSGVKGTFAGNILRPASVGKGKVTARIGDLTAELDIRSLSGPAKLVLSPDLINVQLGQNQSLQVAGTDPQGFTAKIESEDVRWAVKSQIGNWQNSAFYATAVGTGYIEATVGEVAAYSAVSVFSDSTDTVHSFEDNQAVFQVNPQMAQGSYEISAEEVHGGNAAGQLTYDFFDTKGLGEVSLAFSGKGFSLDPATSRLAIWIYNTYENGNRILGEVIDSVGEKHQVEFAAKLNWTGWKQMEASLEKIKGPAYLSRIYVQNADPVAGWGKVYLDDLTAKVSSRPVVDRNKIPANTAVPKDAANRAAAFASGPENFRFSAFANANLDKMVSAGTEYKIENYKNSTFIQLDVSKGGLRRSDPQQWIWLFQELDKLTGSNVFVVMSADPAGFINAKEAELLKDTLAAYREKTGKNVWVFYQGKTDQSEMDRGVRYISSSASSTLQVTVLGDEITYEFKGR